MHPARKLILFKGGGGVSFASLFAVGVDGFLYYPALAANLSQDSAGATPVVANDDPVGRFVDQSPNGKNATQTTGTRKPRWKTNSGKPYLSYDGVDDWIISTVPGTAAMTLAVAFNSATASGIFMGGGSTSGPQRCQLGLGATGALAAGWGGQTIATIIGGSDVRNQDHVGLLTANASTVELWLDGVQVYSAAASGTPAGQSTPIVVGGNNNLGSLGSYSAMRAYAVLALAKRVTPAEIAFITDQFRSTYQ